MVEVQLSLRYSEVLVTSATLRVQADAGPIFVLVRLLRQLFLPAL